MMPTRSCDCATSLAEALSTTVQPDPLSFIGLVADTDGACLWCGGSPVEDEPLAQDAHLLR